MATHSSILSWRIPGTGEPGKLPSMGSHRLGHDSSDLAAEQQHIPRVLKKNVTLSGIFCTFLLSPLGTTCPFKANIASLIFIWMIYP